MLLIEALDTGAALRQRERERGRKVAQVDTSDDDDDVFDASMPAVTAGRRRGCVIDRGGTRRRGAVSEDSVRSVGAASPPR